MEYYSVIKNDILSYLLVDKLKDIILTKIKQARKDKIFTSHLT